MKFNEEIKEVEETMRRYIKSSFALLTAYTKGEYEDFNGEIGEDLKLLPQFVEIYLKTFQAEL
jgi:hypothetical protein